jgi:RNA-binding protein
MPITSKQRAELRAEANRLAATVHVGNQGLSDTLLQTVHDALRTRELVKIQLGKHLEESPKQLAGEIAGLVKADVVQVIGRVATLYRENPELERKRGAQPPWRQ